MKQRIFDSRGKKLDWNNLIKLTDKNGDITIIFPPTGVGKSMFSDSLNPVADFFQHPDQILLMLIMISKIELNQSQFNLAKSSARTTLLRKRGIDVPTVLDLVSIWDNHPELIDFATSIRQKMIPN